MLPQVESLIFAYCGAILALPEGTLLWLQRCDFRTVKNPFPLTTAAQNIHIFPRKSPLCRSHFFEWLKTAISSNACGTSTLKSPLSLGADAPHVHPRLRKRPPRCTLDCGFKTSESPALRGFVGGPRALATAALYLVLKSNGLHRPENLPVKFGFSPKSTSAYISKKLPSQCWPKPLFIAFFNFSHKWPTFAFTSESGVHTRLSAKDRTQGHTRRNRGRFGRGCYHYTRTVSHVSETLRGRVSEWRTLPLLSLGRVCSRRTQKAYGTAMCLCASLSRRRRGPAGLRRPTPPAERTVLAPISPRVQLCLRRPAFPLSVFIPGA